MDKLKKVNDKLYQFHDEHSNMLFTMKFGNRRLQSEADNVWKEEE